MNLQEFKEKAVNDTQEIISAIGGDGCLKVTFGEVFSDEKDHEEHISASVNIYFEYGNCKKEHSINVGWDVLDGFGFEDQEGEILALKALHLIKSMYVDLALEDLDDKHLM